jgi:hypothetical protein
MDQKILTNGQGWKPELASTSGKHDRNIHPD